MDQGLDHFFPGSLGKGLLTGDLPWTSAQRVTMAAFLASYSLHDSYWMGLWSEPASAPVAVIRWDTFWTHGRVEHPGPAVDTWPILLIRFPQIDQLLLAVGTDELSYEGINGAISQPVSATEREALLSVATGRTTLNDRMIEYLLDPVVYHTIIEGIGWHEVHVFHRGEVEVLCLSQEGQLIVVPDLP
jgi:hypothetical protein